MPSNESNKVKRSQIMCGRKGKEAKLTSVRGNSCPRVHIDVTVTAKMKADVRQKAIALGSDQSSIMRLAIEELMGNEDKGTAIGRLIAERENHELERFLHGAFLVLNRLLKQPVAIPAEAPLIAQAQHSISLSHQNEVRGLLRELVRQVVPLLNAKRSGQCAPGAALANDLPRGNNSGGAS